MTDAPTPREVPTTKASQILRDRYFGGSTLFDEDMAAIEREARDAALTRREPLDVETGPWPDCLRCRERHVREGHAAEYARLGAER